MSIFNNLALKVAGSHTDNAVHFASKLKFGFGHVGSTLLGAGIGGAAGLIKGDNYDSTATLRNFSSGAMGGAAIGLGLRAALPKVPGALSHLSGLRHAMASGAGNRMAGFKAGPLGRAAIGAGRIAGPIADKAMRGAGLLGRHPGVTAAAAVLGGAAMYMGGGMRSDPMADAQYDGQDTRTEFMASTQNLVQGLHRGRHR